MLGAAGILVPTLVLGQVYPVQPVKIVVPFAPGGAADLISRVVAERLSGSLGQKVTVENRPGGGGTLATGLVSRAAPDGYTLLYATGSTFVTSPIFQRTPNYDPLGSFAPVSLIGSMPAMIVVNPKVPARTLAELVELLKAEPGRHRYAHGGAGALAYLNGELFKSQTGLDIRDISYKGPSMAAQAVVNGDAEVMLDQAVFFVPRVSEGRLRPLAVMGFSRIPELRDVPTTEEAGFPDLISYNWAGLVAPSGTRAETIDVVNKALRGTLAEIETQATFQKYGLNAQGSTPAQFHRFIQAELTKWARALPLSATIK